MTADRPISSTLLASRPCPQKPSASVTVEKKIAVRSHDPQDGGLASALQIGSTLQSDFQAVVRWRRKNPDAAIQGKFDPKV